MTGRVTCPDCGNELEQVTYQAGCLYNREQFDAVRAGDWYCTTCPSNHRGNTQYRYFWNRELSVPIGTQERE